MLTLGILSLVLSVCAPIGLALGIIAWVMGQGDASKIRRREMDRAGQGMTTGGLICGIFGVALSMIFGLASFVYIVAMIEETERRRSYPYSPPPMRSRGAP